MHYAKAPLCGPFLLPLNELDPDIRACAGRYGDPWLHHGAVDRYSSALAYIVEIPDESHMFKLGTIWAKPDHWVYLVEPIGDVTDDPEQLLPVARTCLRARIVRCLHQPPPAVGR